MFWMSTESLQFQLLRSRHLHIFSIAGEQGMSFCRYNWNFDLHFGCVIFVFLLVAKSRFVTGPFSTTFFVGDSGHFTQIVLVNVPLSILDCIDCLKSLKVHW